MCTAITVTLSPDSTKQSRPAVDLRSADHPAVFPARRAECGMTMERAGLEALSITGFRGADGFGAACFRGVVGRRPMLTSQMQLVNQGFPSHDF
jgi:hypothetical protein